MEGKNLVDLDLITMSDPICVMRSRDPSNPEAEWKYEGETEVIDNNLNRLWIEHFTIFYNMKKDVELLFQVSNHNPQGEHDLIGQVILRLSEIMRSSGLALTKILTLPAKDPDAIQRFGKTKLPLVADGKSRGVFKVRADIIQKTDDKIKFQICAGLKSKKFLCFGANNPYLLIERARNVGNKYGAAHDSLSSIEQIGTEEEDWQ